MFQRASTGGLLRASNESCSKCTNAVDKMTPCGDVIDQVHAERFEWQRQTRPEVFPDEKYNPGYAETCDSF